MNGVNSPFFKILFKNPRTNLEEHILEGFGEEFMYIYQEDGADICTVQFKFPNKDYFDLEYFNPKAEWKVVWGYIGGDIVSRLVVVQDLEPEYNKDYKLIVRCTDKAHSNLMSDSNQNSYQANNLNQFVQQVAKQKNLLFKIQLRAINAGTSDNKIDIENGLEFSQTNKLSPTYQKPTKESISTYEEEIKKDVGGVKRQTSYTREVLTKKPGEGYQNNNIPYKTYLLENPNLTKSEWKEIKNNLGRLPDGRFILLDDILNDKVGSDLPNKPKETYQLNQTFFSAPLEVQKRGYMVQQRAFPTDSIPQGGKNIRAQLNDLGKSEPGGRTIIDTRDDSIIVKKRDFAQTPIKTYEINSSEGIVLDFKPEYKNTTKKGPADSAGYSGFNRFNKQFYQGSADNTNSPAIDTLVKLQQMLNYVKKQKQSEVYGSGYFDHFTGKFVYQKANQYNRRVRIDLIDLGGTWGRQMAFDAYGSTTQLARDPLMSTYYYTMGDVKKVLENKIQESVNQLEGKSNYSPDFNDANGAYNRAANIQQDAELQRNPAVIAIEGDPSITVSKVISIINTAKRHSGNYYQITTTHKINKASGYITEQEIVRDGNNHVGTPVEMVGKKPNTKLGNRNSKVTKSIPSNGQ